LTLSGSFPVPFANPRPLNPNMIPRCENHAAIDLVKEHGPVVSPSLATPPIGERCKVNIEFEFDSRT
jgi:hypothetical protein